MLHGTECYWLGGEMSISKLCCEDENVIMDEWLNKKNTVIREKMGKTLL